MTDQILRVSGHDPLRTTFRFRTVLEEVPIGVRLTMNSRSFRWAIEIFDSIGTALIEGFGLACQVDIWHTYRSVLRDQIPPGKLFVVDTEGSDPPLGPTAWRERWTLVYRPIADVSISTLPRVV